MRRNEPGPISLSARPPGALVGRAAESAAIQRMVGRARLVTITGPPGVGKTAVGIAAAAAMRTDFADGAWLVPLDSLRDADLLPHTIADALRVPDQLTRGRLEALVDELRDRRLLLVLDTCEHLIGACAGLAMRLLLPPCPGVRILVTSREPLSVPGGLTMTIRPLPLAIELAARQLASGSLEELRSRLREDYWFLRNSGDSPPRHETLRTAIGWSHQLCSPPERLLWARLSVFR